MKNKFIGNKTIINYIKSQRLGWLGHVHRMPDERMVKKVYEWKPMAIRSLGRPQTGGRMMLKIICIP